MPVGEEIALQPPQRPIDSPSHQRDDHQHQQDRLPLTAPLRNIDQIAKPTRIGAKLHQLREHHIAKCQAKQQPQRVENGRSGQRSEHLQNDLPARRPQCERGIDIPLWHIEHCGSGVADHKGRTGDEQKHHLLKFADPKQEERQRNEGRHGDIPAKDSQRCHKRPQRGKTGCQNAQRHPHQRRQTKSEADPLERYERVGEELPFAKHLRDRPGRFHRARHHRRTDKPILTFA